MAANIKLIKKLQLAINKNGGNILYFTGQFYSKEQDRPVTVYTIKTSVFDEKRGKSRNIELFSSTSQIQIVLFLRDYWYEMNGWEIPKDNQYWNDAKDSYYKRKESAESKKEKG